MRVVLAAGRRAGMPFGEGWAIAAETTLSYMSERKAKEWWDALDHTERAWADAYARRDSRLADLLDVCPCSAGTPSGTPAEGSGAVRNGSWRADHM